MNNLNNFKPKVKGHGSFALREGWINKALTLLSQEGNERLFSSSKAADILGIGTNMVPALRYWLQCFGLVEEKGNKGTFLSEFGEVVLKYDSYLEDTFTLWILHSNLVKNREKATLFHDYYNEDKFDAISRNDLLEVFKKKWAEFSLPEKSIKADVDVLVNTYCRTKVNEDPEDKIVSPFNELKLIAYYDDILKKQQPDLRMMQDEVILYELSTLLDKEYRNSAKNEKRFISIDKVATGEYSLSAIYNISRVATNQMLSRLEALKYIRVDRTAGLDVIYDIGIPKPMDIIYDYYLQR